MRRGAGTGCLRADSDVAEYLLLRVGLRFAGPLANRFAWALWPDEIDDVLSIAATRLWTDGIGPFLSRDALKRKYGAYCVHVAQEIAASTWNEQRRRERRLPRGAIDRGLLRLAAPRC